MLSKYKTYSYKENKEKLTVNNLVQNVLQKFDTINKNHTITPHKNKLKN